MTYLSNSNGDGQWSEFLIECDQHAWLYGGHNVEENIMRLAKNHYNKKSIVRHTANHCVLTKRPDTLLTRCGVTVNVSSR